MQGAPGESYNRNGIEFKTEVDRKRATWDKERIKPFVMPGCRGLEADEVEEKNKVVKELEEQWGKSGDVRFNHLTRSVNLEFVIYHDLEEKNWLGEDERYDELIGDNDGFPTRTFPAAKYDDYIHGVDIIGVVNNAGTSFTPVPFAIDATSDFRERRIAHHLGTPYKDVNGHRVRGYEDLRGFTSVTFFQDSTYLSDESYPKGTIPILPRFVVGFDNDMAKQISGLDSLRGRQSVSLNDQWDAMAFDIEAEKFEDYGDFSRKTPKQIANRLSELELRANWIVVHEMTAQIESMEEALTQFLSNDVVVEPARQYVAILKEYLSGAEKIIDRKVPKGSEMRARCENDPVYKKIMAELKTDTPKPLQSSLDFSTD